MERQDQIREITESLEQGVKDLFESQRYREYLAALSQFHNYSFGNTLLIMMQKPDASYVAGFTTWKNKFSRSVNKGEKGIRILAPAPYKVMVDMPVVDKATGAYQVDAQGNTVTEKMEVKKPAFKVVHVFDVKQTSGEPLPKLAHELTGNVESFDSLFHAIKSASPYPIEFEDIQSSAKGYCSFSQQRIAIKEGMSQQQTLKTAIHEVAHAMLHPAVLNERTRNTIEVEAESVAFTVCQHYGVDTSDYSFGYVANWSNGKELSELKKSLDTIQKGAQSLIERIDNQLKDLSVIREGDKVNQPKYGEYTFTQQEIDSMSIGNYVAANQESLFFDIGVPLGSLSQFDSKGKHLSKRDFQRMSDSEYYNIKPTTKLIPLESMEQVERSRLQFFEALQIHPHFISISQAPQFGTVLNYLQMFSGHWEQINADMKQTKPITFEKMMAYRDKHLTPDVLQGVSKKYSMPLDKIHALLGIDNQKPISSEKTVAEPSIKDRLQDAAKTSAAQAVRTEPRPLIKAAANVEIGG